RLMWIIVRRQWAIRKSFRCKQPASAIRLHDKRIAAIKSIRPRSVNRRTMRRVKSGRAVRHVITCPAARFWVPPDVLLAFRPRRSIWSCRSTVVQDTTVGRPRPAPLECNLILGGARYLASRLVYVVLEDTGVNPATTRGTAISCHLGIA